MTMATTLEQVNELLRDQTNRTNYLYQQLEKAKKDLDEMKDKYDQMQLRGHGDKNRKSMTHAKHFNPMKYAGLRGVVGFRAWTGDIKVMALRYSQNLHDKILKSEYLKVPITKEHILAEGVTVEEDLELFMILRAFTEGSAHVFVEICLSRARRPWRHGEILHWPLTQTMTLLGWTSRTSSCSPGRPRI